MNIPDEAVESAAKVMANANGEGWIFEPPTMDGVTRSATAPEVYLREARAALEAAAPCMVREAQAEAWSEGTHFGGLYRVVFPNDNPYRSNQ